MFSVGSDVIKNELARSLLNSSNPETSFACNQLRFLTSGKIRAFLSSFLAS